MDAGTGVFTQTGGSVGSLGSGGVNNAVGLSVGGNWTSGITTVTVTASLASHHAAFPYISSAVGTFTLGNTNGTARRSSSAASKASASPALARSPKIAGPTPSSAEATIVAL